jgi:transposase
MTNDKSNLGDIANLGGKDRSKCTCKNKDGGPKIWYWDKAQADAKAVEYNAKYKNSTSHSYECIPSAGWHLTTSPVGVAPYARNGALHNAQTVASAAPESNTKTPKTRRSDGTKMAAFALDADGTSAHDIAAKLGVSVCSIYNWLKNESLKKQFAESKTVVAVDALESLDAEETRLLAQLASVKAKKAAEAAAREAAKAWQFCIVHTGVKADVRCVSIKKENQSLTVPVADAVELSSKLMSYLSSIKASAASA